MLILINLKKMFLSKNKVRTGKKEKKNYMTRQHDNGTMEKKNNIHKHVEDPGC